jgi:hypothetical protein
MPEWLIPGVTAVLAFAVAVALLDQWLERRRSFQLAWAIGMFFFGIGSASEAIAGAAGWSEPLYRVWYLIGAVWVAGWLGLGTVYLLGRTRFGYSFALSLGLAGLFTFLSWRRYDYPDSGSAPFIYLAAALVLAVVVVVLTWRRDARWVHVAGAVVLIGTVVSAAMMATVTLPAPGWAVDSATHIPTGELFPGYLRLLTPFFNITGAYALTFGAIYSTYVFMPKRRLIRYSLGREQSPPTFLANLLIAPVAVAVNLVASVPGAFVALVSGRLHSRVPATILIALGGLIPAITSGANRFGATSAFFVGELLGVTFLFIGFLVSIEVFGDFRVPFTRHVLRSRRSEAT